MPGTWIMMVRRPIVAIWLSLAIPAIAQDRGWVTSWATSPMAMEGEHALPRSDGAAVTVRETVRLSLGGDAVRLRITNRHGRAPLIVEEVRVGSAADTGADTAIAGSARAVRFGGANGVTVPPGAEYWSDAVTIAIAPRDRLLVTIRAVADGVTTGHPGARSTSFVAVGTGAPVKSTRWYWLSAVDVTGPAGATIAVLGDSITDGYGVKQDGDGRWTDYLAARLQADPATRHLGIANQGIGGNRLLLDGTGPNALARFDRDVLALSNVRYLILLIGVNDLGTLTRDAPVSRRAHGALVARMIAGYRQVVARARAAGIRVIGTTILPYGGSAYYHPDGDNEADRRALNAWLRAPGNVDAVVDFDAAMRDAGRPERLRGDLDSGDGLHPSDAGYRAMADAVPLGLFVPDRPQVVLTFDDLPLHGPLPKGVTADDVAKSLTATLRRHRVPDAYAFVNAKRIVQDAAMAGPLRTWVKAGYALGNHGYDHAALSKIGLGGFAHEIEANEPVLKAEMGGRDWHYFRYPFLDEGSDAQMRARARRMLADRGYAIAPVGFGFDDWRFNTVYARCVAARDKTGVTMLEARFLAAARASLATARAAARTRFGREVPQVLLLHTGAFTAHMLPRLLDLYEREGVAFGRLATALADPVYAVARTAATEDASDPVRSTGPDTTAIETLCRRPT